VLAQPGSLRQNPRGSKWLCVCVCCACVSVLLNTQYLGGWWGVSWGGLTVQTFCHRSHTQMASRRCGRACASSGCRPPWMHGNTPCIRTLQYNIILTQQLILIYMLINIYNINLLTVTNWCDRVWAYPVCCLVNAWEHTTHENLCTIQYNTTYKRFTALWILSGTTQVSWYQKNHSPTHTYHGHQSSLICFIHLLWSTASSLFNPRTWQSFSTISLQVFFGLPLGLAPSTSYSIHFFTQSSSSFRNTCPYHHNLIQSLQSIN